MRKQPLKFAFTVGFLLALVCTFSCGNDGGDEQGGSFNENSQIYVRKNGVPYKGSGDIKIGNTIKVGSVTSGIVKFELSKITIPAEHLSDFYVDEQFSCEDYPTDIKAAKVDYFRLYYSNSDDELLGKLRIEYPDEQIWEGIFYLYSSKDGKITCNSASDGGSFKINTDVKARWNKIYFRKTRNSEEWSTDNILTKEMKWTIDP